MKFSKKKSLQKKRFYGHVECSFDKQAEKFWTKSSRKFGSKSENDWKKNLFLWKNFYLLKRSSGFKKAVVTDPPK